MPRLRCGAAGLSAVVVPGGVDYDAMDGAPVDLLFLIAAPDTEDNVHLQVLSQLAVLLMDGDFTTKLRNAKSEEEFLRVIVEAEKVTGEAAEKVEPSVQKYQVLAVTACLRNRPYLHGCRKLRKDSGGTGLYHKSRD